MSRERKLRPTPAMIVALIALVAAMSGAALALPGKNSVNSGDLKDGAVRSKDIKKNAVRSKQIKGRSVKGADVQEDALKGRQVFEDKLEAVPEAKTVQTVQLFDDTVLRVTAAEGETDADARAAADQVPLAANGDLSLYAKCFRNTATDELQGVVYAATGSAGSILSSPADTLPGGQLSSDFLNPDTDEPDREVAVETLTGPGASFSQGSGSGFRVVGADGSVLTGVDAVAVKSGELAEGDGVYGEGSVCLFGGVGIG